MSNYKRKLSVGLKKNNINFYQNIKGLGHHLK